MSEPSLVTAGRAMRPERGAHPAHQLKSNWTPKKLRRLRQRCRQTDARPQCFSNGTEGGCRTCAKVRMNISPLRPIRVPLNLLRTRIGKFVLPWRAVEQGEEGCRARAGFSPTWLSHGQRFLNCVGHHAGGSAVFYMMPVVLWVQIEGRGGRNYDTRVLTGCSKL